MNGLFEVDTQMAPVRLLQVIKDLKNRFFTLEEFPFLDRNSLPGGILSQAMNIQESEVRDYAFTLKGQELEGLILDIRDASEKQKIQRGCQILAIRATPRILKLLSILFQYNYKAQGLQAVLRCMADKMGNKDVYSLEETLISSLGQVEDKISALCLLIDEHGNSIPLCFKTLNISEKSPLAAEAAYQYLTHATKEGLAANQRWITSTIKSRYSHELQGLIQNILSTFTLYEYRDVINLEILSKLGKPNTSLEWNSYPYEIRLKFNQWHYLYKLRIHSIVYPKKFIILSRYVEQIVNSYVIKDNDLMIIDFGDIILADIKGNPNSYFYEKKFFEKEMKEWQRSREAAEQWDAASEVEKPKIQLPTFLKLEKKSLTARDFIIEEAEDACIKLSYEGIDVLYIHEMLDIKMGLEPDMRKRQLSKLKEKILKDAN